MSSDSSTPKNLALLSSPHRSVGAFPELRIARREDLLLHEDTDTGRQIALVNRLAGDGVLRNPPVVARLRTSHQLLLLDGANRVAALDCLEIPHVLVQVEEYDDPALVLSHWNHVVRDTEAGTILDMLKTVPGLVVVERPSLEETSDFEPRQLCTLAFGEKRSFQVLGGLDISERVRQLGRICNLYYHGIARIDRVGHVDLETLEKQHRHFGALIVYRDFTKSEIRQAAEAGNRLPSGLTRFLLPRRVLGFNIPLDLLKSGASMEEKQRRLEEILRHKVAERKVRYYEEPAFIFDD